MNLGSKRVFATIAAAAALAAGIGAGSAGAKPRAHGAVLKAAVQYIGVSRAELLKDARAGQTLAQIATAHGKTVAGLEAAMLAAIKAKLETSKLTPAQQQAKLARAEKLVDRLVNAKLAAGKQRAAKAGLLRLSAKYIGVTPQALRAELKAGKSLAQVATGHGKTAAGLKAAILKPIQTRLTKAVASGRLTSAQAQTRLDRLSARLDKLITKTL